LCHFFDTNPFITSIVLVQISNCQKTVFHPISTAFELATSSQSQFKNRKYDQINPNIGMASVLAAIGFYGMRESSNVLNQFGNPLVNIIYNPIRG